MSALDAKLREAMQVELRQLQQRLGITTIVVTHDQREAMTMADLVVVMGEGRIRQAAPPIEIYRRPADAFVADFIGSTNLLAIAADGAGRATVLGRPVLPGLAMPSGMAREPCSRCARRTSASARPAPAHSTAR
jgi:putative spermidine/putrescine transport system ATP-binding protein